MTAHDLPNRIKAAAISTAARKTEDGRWVDLVHIDTDALKKMMAEVIAAITPEALRRLPEVDGHPTNPFVNGWNAAREELRFKTVHLLE